MLILFIKVYGNVFDKFFIKKTSIKRITSKIFINDIRFPHIEKGEQ